MKTKEEIYDYLWKELGWVDSKLTDAEDRSEFDGALDKISKDLATAREMTWEEKLREALR